MSASQFFDRMLSNFRSSIHTCLIGRIERFDPVKMQADVQPLFYDEQNHAPMPLLLSVPVAPQKAGGFFIRMPYKKGDLVVVVCAQQDIDEITLKGEMKQHNSGRKHDLSDAIVVCGFHPFSLKLPEEHKEDLLFATEDMKAKFVITKDRQILIHAENGVQIVGKDTSGAW
jgi:hypothetical protein